ncbi:hypothetical protein GCM10023335_28150 [Streptomyces siamensis]|uniref:Uncharacterized protein n=1 Tax=Streptomyces siamensis TaxID=1274986 RepID=A0ABP9IUG1_9ACTN
MSGPDGDPFELPPGTYAAYRDSRDGRVDRPGLSIQRAERVWEGDGAFPCGCEEDAIDGGIPRSEGLAVAVATQSVAAPQ